MGRMLSVCAVVAALLAITACAAASSAPSPAPTASAEPAIVDISDLGAKSITVEPFGDFLMSSGDLVWVSGVDPGIVAYDDTMTPVFEVAAGTVWAALEFGHGYIWCSEAPDGHESTTLLRIDPASGAATRFALPAPGIPGESSIAVTDDAVWVIISGHTPDDYWSLVGVDPGSGAVVRTLEAGAGTLAAVRGGFGSLWVTRPSGVLARVDPVSGDMLAEIELPTSSTFLSVSPDAVWVMNQRGDVSRVDPVTNEVVATISVNPDGIIGGDIVATSDAVWVQANTYLGVEIDPATNTVLQRVMPAEGSGGIAIAGDGAVWITAHDVHKLYRTPPD